MTQVAQCQETQSCLYNILFARTVSPSQGSEKQNYLFIHFYGPFFLFKLCYQSEIKELLIACVFKCSLEMLTKLDYFKCNAAKDLKFKLQHGKNVAGSIPKGMA